MTKESKSILILDNKASRRDTLASRFRLQGMKVELSTSGFQALSQVEKESYDTVLMIGNLYDMSAHEMIGLMRSVYDKDELQIIYSDKKVDEEIVMEMLKNGASEFVLYSEKIFGTILPKIEAFKPKSDRKAKTLMDAFDS